MLVSILVLLYQRLHGLQPRLLQHWQPLVRAGLALVWVPEGVKLLPGVTPAIEVVGEAGGDLPPVTRLLDIVESSTNSAHGQGVVVLAWGWRRNYPIRRGQEGRKVSLHYVIP